MSARPERGWRAALAPWLVPLGILALWQLAAQAGWLSSRILPAPSAVAAAAWSLAVSGELWLHLRVSAARLVGPVAGRRAGPGAGPAEWRVAPRRDAAGHHAADDPQHSVLALIPLFILWFGIEETAKLALLSVGVFFPFISTRSTASARWIRR